MYEEYLIKNAYIKAQSLLSFEGPQSLLNPLNHWFSGVQSPYLVAPIW